VSDIQQLVNGYLDRCQHVRRLSENTVRAYKADLKQFCDAIGRTKQLPDVSPDAIREHLMKMARNHDISPSTVKRRLAAIRSFVREVDEDLARQTFGLWKLPIRAPQRLPRALSRSDLASLLAPADRTPSTSAESTETTMLCLTILAATGLRVSELCSLRVQHVDAYKGELRVMGKGSRERVVFLPDSTLRAQLAAHVAALDDAASLNSPVFANGRGRPLTPQCFRLRLHRLAKNRAFKKSVTPHMLRHTAATMLVEAGIDIRFVQRLLGHASIATTQIYTHVSNVALRDALERANVIGSVVGRSVPSAN